MGRQRGLTQNLCELPIVAEFRAIYSNPKIVTGREVRKCPKKAYKNIDRDEQRSYKELANELFNEICQSYMLIKAHLKTKGSSIGVDLRTCSKEN